MSCAARQTMRSRPSLQHLRQQHAQPVEAEELGADDLDPDWDGRLVERDEARRIDELKRKLCQLPIMLRTPALWYCVP